MSQKIQEYKRLPGKGKTLLGHNTLWSGPDHLLAVEFRLVSEEYKRFYYSDIQSIITCKTVHGKILNLIIFAFMALFSTLAFLSGQEFSIFWWVMFSLAAFFLTFNWFRGPTCACYLETAVQTEKLPSLNRLETAGKAIKILKVFIERAQGRLQEVVLEANMASGSRTELLADHGKSSLTSIRHEKGTVHIILFALLLSDALLTTIDLFYNHIALTLLGNGIFLSAGLFMVVSLVKQANSDMRTSLCAVTWATAGYLGFSVISGYILFFSILIQKPGIVNNQWTLIRAISDLQPLNSPFLSVLYIASICFALGLGVFGLILMLKHKKAVK